MTAYDDVKNKLAAFKSNHNMPVYIPFANNDKARLAQLFEQLLKEIDDSSYSPNKKDRLYRTTGALIESLNKNDNIQQQLKLFNAGFNINKNCLIETSLSIAATIAGIVTGLLGGLFAGIVSVFALAPLACNEGIRAALYAPFEFTCIGATLGYQFAETPILGTPRAITHKVVSIHNGVGFFKAATQKSLNTSHGQTELSPLNSKK